MQEREIVSACGGPSMIVKSKSAASLMASRAILTTRNPVSSRKLAHVETVPYLSASINNTFCPRRLRQAATLIESVDLPTPPF